MAKRVFATQSLPLQREIRCDSRRWNRHILIRHPELSAQEAVVEEAVRDPDVVTLDAGNARRRCLYRFNVGIISHAPHLKVVVELSHLPWAGKVVTAFCVDKIKSSEAPKWRRTPPIHHP
jgi:hypothetical protein